MPGKSTRGMHKSGGTKARGRPRVSGATDKSTRSGTRQSLRVNTTRPAGRGSTIQRDDRRDTNPQFTGNNRRQPNFGDPLGSGKKQIQGGGKATRGGGKREKGTYDH